MSVHPSSANSHTHTINHRKHLPTIFKYMDLTQLHRLLFTQRSIDDTQGTETQLNPATDNVVSILY